MGAPDPKMPQEKEIPQGKKLVEAIIELVSKNPAALFWSKKNRPQEKPLSSGEVENLCFRERPLSESLKRWLLFDRAIEGADFGPKSELWDIAPFPQQAERYIGVPAKMLKAHPFTDDCLFLAEAWGGDGATFLYLGSQDSVGEYPVIQTYIRDPSSASVSLWHPGFDLYIASALEPEYASAFSVHGGGDVIKPSDPHWGNRLKEHMKNLGLSKPEVRSILG